MRCTARCRNGQPCIRTATWDSPFCSSHTRQCMCAPMRYQCSQCHRSRVLHGEVFDSGRWHRCPRTESDRAKSLGPWHGSRKRGTICDPCWAPSHQRQAIPRAVRALVVPGPCVYCGVTGAATVDHVIPVAQGGRDDLANLVRACKPCNSSKGGRTPEQWFATGQAPTQLTLFAKFAADVTVTRSDAVS